MSNKKGFTIVELLAVIVIIALLSALLIPAANNVRKKANLKTYETKVYCTNVRCSGIVCLCFGYER